MSTTSTSTGQTAAAAVLVDDTAANSQIVGAVAGSPTSDTPADSPTSGTTADSPPTTSDGNDALENSEEVSGTGNVPLANTADVVAETSGSATQIADSIQTTNIIREIPATSEPEESKNVQTNATSNEDTASHAALDDQSEIVASSEQVSAAPEVQQPSGQATGADTDTQTENVVQLPSAQEPAVVASAVAVIDDAAAAFDDADGAVADVGVAVAAENESGNASSEAQGAADAAEGGNEDSESALQQPPEEDATAPDVAVAAPESDNATSDSDQSGTDGAAADAAAVETGNAGQHEEEKKSDEEPTGTPLYVCCRKDHRMTLYTNGERVYEPRLSVRCDVCRECSLDMRCKPFFHCHKCRFDFCQPCAMQSLVKQTKDEDTISRNVAQSQLPQLKWTIHNFEDTKEDCIESDEFELQGTTWKLCVYKNGDTAENQGWISAKIIYCGSKLAASEIDAKYEIAVLNQKGFITCWRGHPIRSCPGSAWHFSWACAAKFDGCCKPTRHTGEKLGENYYHLHCDQGCGYVVCQRCYRRIKGIVTCPKHHRLIPMGPGRCTWSCDSRGECKRGPGAYRDTDGQPRYRCQQCDYDYCGACFDHKQENDIPTFQRGKKNHFVANTTAHGFGRLVYNTDLQKRGFVHDDGYLEVVARICVVGDEYLARSDSMAADYQGLLQGGELTDFVIKGDSYERPVHRAVLCARSPVFRAMLKSNMQEAQTRELTIDGVCEKAMDALVSWMYYDAVPSAEIAESVLAAADRFQMSQLVYVCSVAMEKAMSLDNVLSRIKLARKLPRGQKLLHICEQYLVRNFQEVAESTVFLQLMSNEPEMVQGIVKNVASRSKQRKK